MESGALSLTPNGHLLPVPTAPELTEDLRRRFERGTGHGLLALGLDMAGASLGPVLAWWRDFGSRFVSAVCAQPESVVAPAAEELEALARSAPPMIGAEYLTGAVLQSLWSETHKAFESELAESRCGLQEFLKRRNPAWNLVGRVHFN